MRGHQLFQYNFMVTAKDPAIPSNWQATVQQAPPAIPTNTTPDDLASQQPEAPPPQNRRSPLIALQHRDFRLLFFGSFVSQLGSQMRIMAVNAHLWDLSHSLPTISLLALFQLVPLLVLSLFGGVIADALDRRRLLMATQTTLALSSVLLAVATQFGWISPPVIFIAAAMGASALAFDNPARSALTPNLVPRQHLPNALSLNIIVWQIATIVGPTVGGAFLGLGRTGYTIIYWFDAVSFTAVLLALFFIRTRTDEHMTRDVSLKSAFDGLRFLRRAPIIMSTMTLDFFATFFGGATMLFPAFADQVLHVDRSYLGFMYAAPAVGAVVAGIVMSWLGNVRRQGYVVLFSVAFYGICTILWGSSHFFLITLVALAGVGAADTVSMVMRQTIRQLSTPDELRGRMTSVNMLFYIGGPRLGEFEAGIAAQLLGLGPSVMLGGAGVLVATAVLGRIVPALRNYDRASVEHT